MIEILEAQKEQYGISTFNKTLNDIFERDNVEAMINYSGQTLDDDGIYIYSSKCQADPETLENRGTHIFVVHGIHNDNFLPPEDYIFDQIWCFSSRVNSYLTKHGYKNIKQVPQVIDDKFWKTDKSPTGNVLIVDPRNGLFYSNRVHEAVINYPSQIGVRVVTKMLSVEDLRDEIENASVVIAKGRSAMESILLGRPTIIYGHECADGLTTKDNVEDLMTTNMSGWSKKKDIDISNEIEKAFEMSTNELSYLRSDMVKRVGSSLIKSDMYL